MIISAHGRSCTHLRRLVLGFAIVMLVAAAASAQDAGSAAADENSVFAPFVSRIRISTRDPEIRLTWQDSPDVSGTYRVYRYTAEITPETFLSAELVGEVEPGVQSFIDTPPEPGDFYYSVLAESAAGELYEIFIPYRNATAVPVTIQNTATLEERAARVRDITVTEEAGTVLVEYRSDQVGRQLIVYRSTRPFTTGEDLTGAGVVATIMSSVESVTDYPVPGVPYYYGVVDSALVADGSAQFVSGENATEAPVEIPLAEVAAEAVSEPEPPVAEPPAPEPAPADVAAAPEAVEHVSAANTGGSEEPEAFVPEVTQRRPLPLPFLQLNTDLQTGAKIGDSVITVPQQQPISADTQATIDALLADVPPVPIAQPEPVVLTEDTLPSPRGAEYTLRTILDGPFAAMAWEEATMQFDNFLSLPLTADVRSRVLFYRAQCYYFTGDPRRAFVEFLLARDAHFTEVERWLDIILTDSIGA